MLLWPLNVAVAVAFIVQYFAVAVAFCLYMLLFPFAAVALMCCCCCCLYVLLLPLLSPALCTVLPAAPPPESAWASSETHSALPAAAPLLHRHSGFGAGSPGGYCGNPSGSGKAAVAAAAAAAGDSDAAPAAA